MSEEAVSMGHPLFFPSYPWVVRVGITQLCAKGLVSSEQCPSTYEPCGNPALGVSGAGAGSLSRGYRFVDANQNLRPAPNYPHIHLRNKGEKFKIAFIAIFFLSKLSFPDVIARLFCLADGAGLRNSGFCVKMLSGEGVA